MSKRDFDKQEIDLTTLTRRLFCPKIQDHFLLKNRIFSGILMSK